MKSARIAVRALALALTPGGARARSMLARVMTAVVAGTFTAAELAEARVRQWAWFGDEHGSRKQGLFPSPQSLKTPCGPRM